MKNDRPTTDDPTPTTDPDPADTWPPELQAKFDPATLAREGEALWNQFRRGEAEDRRELERLAARL